MLLLFAVIGTVTGRGGLSNTRVEVHDLPLFQHRAAGPRPTAVVVKEGEKKIVTRGTRLRRNDGYEYGAGLSATMLCSQLAPLTSSTFLVDLNTIWRSSFFFFSILWCIAAQTRLHPDTCALLAYVLRCSGIMFDAGSSGTRCYVYKWPKRKSQFFDTSFTHHWESVCSIEWIEWIECLVLTDIHPPNLPFFFFFFPSHLQRRW